MNDQLFISALKLLPKNAVSRLAGALTRWNAPAPVRLAAMKAFAARYGIDLSECPDLEVYRTFGEFFARPLRPGLRPIAPGETVVVSPVDGVVSEAGAAVGGRLVQAKGIDYSVSALVGDEALARGFRAARTRRSTSRRATTTASTSRSAARHRLALRARASSGR